MAFKKGNIPWNKGVPRSEETRKKISESRKGQIPWNKGIPCSDEIKQNISRGTKGRKAWNKGISRVDETKYKISKTKQKNVEFYRYKFQGKNNPMYGNHLTLKTKLKISEANKGENSGRWKGGISSLTNLIRANFKNRQWISDVFTRDKFTCQGCGQIGGKLNAHHIKSFSSILQFYEITTLEEALECEELWNMNNGITYCKKCHEKLHKEVIEDVYIS
ncbi:hypothetical protein ES708_31501 [subsurface metagenome]